MAEDVIKIVRAQLIDTVLGEGQLVIVNVDEEGITYATNRKGVLGLAVALWVPPDDGE